MAIKLTGINKSNAAKNLAKNYKFIPHLDKALAEDEFEWEAKFERKAKDDAFHPSGDCTPSLHELWAKATGNAEEREPFGAGLRKTFAVGHFWHAYLQWATVEVLGFAGWSDIERRGMVGWGGQERESHFDHIGTPYLWEPWHWATGSADIAPVSIPGQGDFLVDFKTQNGRAFAQPNPPDWCADKWECQFAVYMEWFDLDQTICLCINKDAPHDFKEFIYVRNPELADAIHEKWKLVSQCVAEGIEPPVDEPWDLPLRGHVKT